MIADLWNWYLALWNTDLTNAIALATLVVAVATASLGLFGWLLSKFAKSRNLPENGNNTALLDRLTAEIERRAKAEEKIDGLKDAVADALKAAETDPQTSVEMIVKGIEDGNTAQAEAALGRVMAENERKGQAHNAEAARAALHIGILAYYHDTQKALKHFTKATELDPNSADAWNQLGHILKRTGELDRAANAYRRVEALGNQIDDKWVLAVAYGNLGTIEQTRGNLDQAVAFNEQSLAINIELGRKEGIASIYGNLGVIEHKRGNLDQAATYHKKSLTIHTELGSKAGMANQYGNLGIVEQTRDNLELAVVYYQKSLAIEIRLSRKEGMANAYANWGNVEEMRGDLDEARRLWGLALELFTEVGMTPQIEQVSGWLGRLDGPEGD